MNNYSPFDDNDQDPEFKNFDLGDALAKDEELESFLEYLASQTNEDAPQTRPSLTQELLALVLSPFCLPKDIICKSFNWIRERLTNHTIRVATSKNIDSKTKINNAKATAIRAESKASVETKTAQAEAVRTDSLIKLIDKLDEKGIDWKAKYDKAGHMHIVFTKGPGGGSGNE